MRHMEYIMQWTNDENNILRPRLLPLTRLLKMSQAISRMNVEYFHAWIRLACVVSCRVVSRRIVRPYNNL